MKSQRHSETSTQAAVAIEDRAGTLRAKVREYLKSQGLAGATDEQIQNALQMNPSTQRPRRVELVEAGRVLDSGKVRKTTSNRNAVVWIAVEALNRPARKMELLS